MALEFNLFEDRDWLNPQPGAEPVLWVREVRLLRRLEAGPDAEIRRIVLHRGLNIVWAEPADPDEAEPALRGRGHDVGKTSFCRLIRYLLGEEHFGNRDLISGVTAKEWLRRAWAMGSIVVAGIPWAVARPLYAGPQSFAMKDRTIDEAIEAPTAERERHDEFVRLLQEEVLKGLPVRTFDDAGNDPIRWLHVLQWLARDQESHLSGLFKWRDESSYHGSPGGLSYSAAQFLARCVLGAAGEEERKQIELREELTREKNTQTDNASFFDRQVSEALKRARKELPNGDRLPEIGEALFVDVVAQHARGAVAAKRAQAEADLKKLNTSDAEEALETSIGATALALDRHDELNSHVTETRDALERYSDKKDPTQEDLDELDEIISKLSPDRAFCEIPVSRALFQCPLLRDKRLSEDGVEESRGDLAEMGAEKREQVAKQLEGYERNLKQIADHLNGCRKKEAAARKRRDMLRKKAEELRERIAAFDAESSSWIMRAEDAAMAHEQLVLARKTQKELESKLKVCEARQEKAQKANLQRQGELARAFLAVCHYFKGKDTDASLKFTRDEINARVGSGGGASKALSCLAFDLSAMIAGLNGVGHHPGFLVHDSPRESDMEPSLYRPLFQLVKHLSDKAGDSFQYIVTTTEAPPAELASPPYLCLKLDGRSSEGKLFRENL